MRTQRQVVDYSLQKRAVLRDVHNGRIGTLEVCDASPYLKNAARFHGEIVTAADRATLLRGLAVEPGGILQVRRGIADFVGPDTTVLHVTQHCSLL